MTSFKTYLESKALSKSTIKHYTTYLYEFITWLDKDNTEPENATEKEITGYLNHLQKKGQGNSTRNIRLNVIKQYFDWQYENGSRSDNPATHIKIRGTKQKKLYPVLTRQELDTLYLDYKLPEKDDPNNKRNWWQVHKLSRTRNKAMLSLVIWQGLTTAEVDKLTEKDIKLREGKIYVAGSRKSNERELELKPQQIMELMEYIYTVRKELLETSKKQTDQLFVSTGENEQSNNNWKRLCHALKAQNPKFINLKQVRTSVITGWLKQHNLRQVQYMAGHRYVSSTEAYMVNDIEDLAEEIQRYHPL